MESGPEIELFLSRQTQVKLANDYHLKIDQFNNALYKLGFGENLTGRLEDDQFIATNGATFDFDPVTNKIDGYLVQPRGDYDALFIAGMPLTSEQRRKLDAYIIENFDSDVKNQALRQEKLRDLFTRLPKDVFYKMVLENNITGKDLLSWCLSDKRFNWLCEGGNASDQKLFKILLQKEYGVWEPLNGSYRDQYVRHSTDNVYVVECVREKFDNDHENVTFKNQPLVKLKQFYGARQVSCRSEHVGILDRKGELYLFGKGDSFRGLHHDHEAKRRIPTKFAVLNQFSNIKQVVCLADFTIFIGEEGALWAFGNSEGYANVGIDVTNRTFREMPRYMPRRSDMYPGPIKQFDAFGWSAIFIIGDENRVYVSEAGQLSLAQVMPKNPVKVACGDTHFVILTSDGSVWTSGGNDHGQLGLETRVRREGVQATSFKRVPQFKNAKQIACGHSMTFVVDKNDNLWVAGGLWKDRDSKRDTFTQLTLFRNVRQVAASSSKAVIATNTRAYLLEDLDETSLDKLVHWDIRDVKNISVGLEYIAMIA